MLGKADVGGVCVFNSFVFPVRFLLTQRESDALQLLLRFRYIIFFSAGLLIKRRHLSTDEPQLSQSL